MMTWILTAMIAASIIFGGINGTIGEVSSAALSGCENAVQLCITLAGAVCLWSGVMKVADNAGVTEMLNRIICKITAPLFKGLKSSSAAMKAISLNITSNMLGLGNAATPFGLRAMSELDRLNGCSKCASDHMILFAVMNSAAFQLIPSASISALRLAHGSTAPLDIMPAVWITSLVSFFSGTAMALLFAVLSREHKYGKAAKKI